MLRDLLAASCQIADLAQRETTLSLDDRIDKAQAVVYALGARRTEGQSDPEPVGSILPDVVQDIQDRFENGGQISGLATGFADLDAKTCGMHPGDLIIVAGRPSMGKTAFALNVAEHVAVNEGKPVLVFSMEMGKKQLSERSIASLGSLPMDVIRSGQLSDEDFSRLSFANGNPST
jgi:replicative DNA helicase